MDEAVERAKYLDDYLEKNSTTIGPLHGVPVSVKEHQGLKGHYSSVGFLDTRMLDDKDAQMVRIFREAGAIFYCKTTQPQGIMHLEGVSQYGRTLNPHNINLSSGGSTAGEASLIALHGSVLGIGTDIGGSIRGPSGFCGIYGFKPTSYYLPMKDFLPGGFGAELNVLCATGPMCNTLRDMDLFVRTIKDAQPHIEDPRLVPIPWKGLANGPKTPALKVGIMMHDGMIVPQAPVTRALEWAISKLKAAPGIEVKPFAPFQAQRAMTNIRKAYWPDGGKVVKDHLAKTGEPMFPLTQWIIKDAEGDDVGSAGVLAQRLERDEFRIEYSAHWESQDVDVLICPVFVGPACEHDTAFYWNYTAFFNYVDYPGVVFPTPVKTLKTGEEDYSPANQTPLSDEDSHVRELWAKGNFEGAPIDLQILARKYHDNELFGALAQLKEVLELP
jgi:amidase